MEDSQRSLEFVVVGVYLLFLLVIGLAFRKFNSNISDFFRNGARGTWWLVGTSSFMAGISAYTFTGASGVAYKAGWSIAIIYIANAAGYLVNFLFLAPWFRQLRVITAPEAIRLRFGFKTQQFYALFGVLTTLLYSSLQLWALAIFSAAVFGFDVSRIIIVVGLVVAIYSTTGGSWAVMATDFVQSLIMIPMTLLVSILCLIEVGGFSGFAALVTEAGLNSNYRLFNDPGEFPAMQFTLPWAAAIFIKQVMEHNTITSARYFGVKDGREARKAALLAFCLMTLGSVLWFIPPMVARLLYENDVATVGASLHDPAEAAFAIASMNLLPLGLMGMIVVAMLAATMSSMDTGLNRNAAIFVRDLYPPLCRLFRKEGFGDRGLLCLGRIFSLVFGFTIIGVALYFAEAGDGGMFDVMLKIGAVLGLPLSIPMLLGLFIRRAPAWSAIVAVLFGLTPGLWAELSGAGWNFQQAVFANMAAGVIGFLLTIPFGKNVPDSYRRQVDDFFERMRRPVDFEMEVGQANDSSQLTLIGWFTLAVGAMILLFLLLPNPWHGRLSIMFVAGTVITIGALMTVAGRRGETRSGGTSEVSEKVRKGEIHQRSGESPAGAREI